MYWHHTPDFASTQSLYIEPREKKSYKKGERETLFKSSHHVVFASLVWLFFFFTPLFSFIERYTV